jgi:hypothetical protein
MSLSAKAYGQQISICNSKKLAAPLKGNQKRTPNQLKRILKHDKESAKPHSLRFE